VLISKLVVERLLDEGALLILINRGKTKVPDSISQNSRVKIIKCDRFRQRKRFRALLRSHSPIKIVDLLAFSEPDVLDVIKSLKHGLSQYIFISTDSVFMATSRRFEGSDNADKALLEEDACVPNDTARQKLRKKNRYQYRYGNGKFVCEQLLLKANRRNELNVTILRLPDVIGPNDNIGSFLELQTDLIQRRSINSKTMSPNGTISLVFVSDVAQAIVLVSTCKSMSYVNGEIFHVTMDERISFKDLVLETSAVLGLELPKLNLNEENELVTVDCGAIDNSKIKSRLKFVPTSLREALEITCAWYASPRNRLHTKCLAQSTDSSSSSSDSDSDPGSDSDSGTDPDSSNDRKSLSDPT